MERDIFVNIRDHNYYIPPSFKDNIKIYSKFKALLDFEDNLYKTEESYRYSNQKERVIFLETIIYFVFRSQFNYFKTKQADAKISFNQEIIYTNAKKRTKEIINNAIKEIVIHTETVTNLKPHFSSSFNCEIDHEYWIKDTFIDDFIEIIIHNKILDRNRMDLTNNSVIARSIGISESFVSPYINAKYLASRHYQRLFYCLILQAILIKTFEFDFYPFSYSSSTKSNDLTIGKSGIRRPFDGLLKIENVESHTYYLTKFINISISDIDTINMIGISLKDIQENIITSTGDNTNCIIFIPSHPTKDSLEHIMYWKNIEHIDINVLYLVDFFEIFRLWEPNKIKRFLIEKLK